MRAFPLLGERPAGAIADGFDEVVESLVEIHLTDFDQDKPSRGASEECKPGIDEGVHGARPANLRMAASLKPARFQARARMRYAGACFLLPRSRWTSKSLGRQP
jgi:hypothetical protein